jgi:hypothetical protein
MFEGIDGAAFFRGCREKIEDACAMSCGASSLTAHYFADPIRSKTTRTEKRSVLQTTVLPERETRDSPSRAV